MEVLGKRIKFFRKQKKLTQEELGKMVGLSTMSIRRYESGEREPDTTQLLKISEALGIHIIDLIENDYVNIEVADNGLHIVSDIITTITDVFENNLINYYRQLNDIGKLEALKRVGELALLDYYKSDDKPRYVVIPNIELYSNEISKINNKTKDK